MGFIPVSYLSMNNNNSGLPHILVIWLLCKFSVTVDNVYEDDKAGYNNKNHVLISSVNTFNVFKLQNGANLYIKHILKSILKTHTYIFICEIKFSFWFFWCMDILFFNILVI